jgi:hypothetical protein
VIEQLDKMKSDRDRSGYAPLVAGTLDVNERWDERRKGPSGAIPDRRETNDRS